MTKLPKNTLEDIDLADLKALFKENKEVFAFKEYFRERVYSSLENEETFGYWEMNKLKEKIEYIKILKEIRPNSSYKLLNLLSKRKTLDEFKSFCNIASIRYILSFSEERTLDFLLGIKENTLELLVNISETPDEFNKLCNKHSVKVFLIMTENKNENKNIENIRKLCKKSQEFEYICKGGLAEIFLYSKTENLEYLLNLNKIQTLNDFEILINNDYIKRILEESNLEALKIIIDFLDINESNFNIFSFNTNILELSINVNAEVLAYLLDLCEVEKGITKIRNLDKFASIYSGTARNLTKGLLEGLRIFDRDIQKQIIDEMGYDSLDKLKQLFSEKFDKIKNHKYGVEFGFLIESLMVGIDLEKMNFPVNKDNFLDFIQDNDDVLFEFEKDKGVLFEGIKPWTKAWFMEKPERKGYLSPEIIKTFEKFGTIIGLGLIEGSQDSKSIKKFYEYIFQTINLEKNRSSILQLGEVFNLILKQENYEIFDDILVNSNIGTEFRKFIEENKISNKGRTILTLMITREIRDSFQIFKNPEGNENVDFSSIETLLKGIQDKLKLYKVEIDKYKNIAIKTSIGMEYEVTQGIAKGYEEIVGSNYKNDIEIISEYAEVAKGNDAVHEIATSPTDNPMLLILEMKLLEDLDFVDLNFKKDDYERASRGLHITLSGEYGIRLDEDSNFIQNILIASNLGGLNAGEEVKGVNRYSNIREKGTDSIPLFDGFNDTLEYRSLSLDKKEQFERMVLSIFNLNMAYQIYNEHAEMQYYNGTLKRGSIEHIYYGKFKKLKEDVIKIIQNHNKNFVKDETIDNEKQENISRLFSLMTSTGPVIQIMQKVGVDIYYFKSLKEEEFSREEFETKLKSDGKDLSTLTERQKEILFGEYDLRIRKELSRIKENDIEIYDNIGAYLNGSTEDTQRKITNAKRWKEVIGEDKVYLKSLEINIGDFFSEITPELINKFTRINNLFIKKDSINALATLDNTMESDGTQISDRRLAETTIFDKLEMGLSPRNGYNIIQGASENMLVQSIQKKILEFNENIFK